MLDREDRGAASRSPAPTAAEYLQGQLTNDVEALAVGEGQYAALLDRKGHMQADMRVLRAAEEEILVDTEAAALPAVLKTPDDVLDRARRRRRRRQRRARRALADRAAQRRGRRHAAAARARLRDGHRRRRPSAWRSARATASTWSAPPPTPSGWPRALRAAGAVEVSPEAVELLRIEAGVPRFGAEMGTETMPAEAGIVERAVSFTKGCYIGQETVARLHYKGKPNRHLRGLRLSAAAEPGAALRLGEKEVGRLGGSRRLPRPGADRAGDLAPRGRARRRVERW